MENTAHIPGHGAGKGIISGLHRNGIDRRLVRIEIVSRGDKPPHMLPVSFGR